MTILAFSRLANHCCPGKSKISFWLWSITLNTRKNSLAFLFDLKACPVLSNHHNHSYPVIIKMDHLADYINYGLRKMATENGWLNRLLPSAKDSRRCLSPAAYSAGRMVGASFAGYRFNHPFSAIFLQP